MIAFTVIGGYLGAGKTTLLNHLLANLQDQRVGLLINDFGEINIDASLIESKTENQINLTNGCVCCTLIDGFHVAVDQLCEIEPSLDQIVVEASGVADVHNLAQYGHGPGMQLDAVLVVADAETIRARTKDKYVAGTIQRQLRAADLIILNKTDLLTSETLETTLDWLHEDYPQARVLPAQNACVPLPLLLGVHDGRQPPRQSDDLASAHPNYTTWHFKHGSTVTRENINDFLQGLDESVLRAKGFARLADGSSATIQVVGSRSDITPLSNDADGLQLVAIGLADQMDRSRLNALAKEVFG